MDARQVVDTGKEIGTIVRDAQITFLAAAIAYFGFVSILPALLLAVAIASALGGETLVETVMEGSGEFLTPAGRDALSDALTSGRGRSGATIVGLGLLVWSTLRVFKGIDIAFSRVYGTSGEDSFVDQLKDAVIAVVTIGIGLLVMITMGGILAMSLPIGADVLGTVLLLLGLSIAFFPLYYIFPDTAVTIRHALPGTVFAAVGWVTLQAGFQIYAAYAQQFAVYGVIGGILLLVTWFYLGAIVLLMGAALNRVLDQ